MTSKFNLSITAKYISQSQLARVLTEDWVKRSISCPACGSSIKQFTNNSPVADFYCPHCKEEYELKSKKNSLGNMVVDGAYDAKMRRLRSLNNPNLLLLTYDPVRFEAKDLVVMPKQFFVPEIIQKRPPLALTARRAGWVGSNILISKVPLAGKIYVFKSGRLEPRREIEKQWEKVIFLRQFKNAEQRGWTLDTMRCVESLGKKEFSLSDIYKFEKKLAIEHPKNLHIKDKLRQQLQILRDKGYLKFDGSGHYRLV